MTTVLEMIRDAYVDANVIGEQDSLSGAEIQRGFRTINRMISAWQVDRLTIYTIQPQFFPLVAGQVSYTIGNGGNFNTIRPVRIDKCVMRDIHNNDYWMDPANWEQYSDIIVKTAPSNLPRIWYYDNNYPLGKIYLWPAPTDASFQLGIYSWTPLQEFASLSDDLIFPPGYEEAIETNLAKRICVQYGRVVPADLEKWSISSLANIKDHNAVAAIPLLRANALFPGRWPYPTYWTGPYWGA